MRSAYRLPARLLPLLWTVGGLFSFPAVASEASPIVVFGGRALPVTGSRSAFEAASAGLSCATAVVDGLPGGLRCTNGQPGAAEFVLEVGFRQGQVDLVCVRSPRAALPGNAAASSAPPRFPVGVYPKGHDAFARALEVAGAWCKAPGPGRASCGAVLFAMRRPGSTGTTTNAAGETLPCARLTVTATGAEMVADCGPEPTIVFARAGEELQVTAVLLDPVGESGAPMDEGGR